MFGFNEGMPRPLAVAIALVALNGPLSGQTQDAAGFPASFTGRWTSSPFELTLSSDLHRSVYGPDARSVRVVSMVIRPSGEGTFTVQSSVRDRRGRTVAGTRQIQQIQFVTGDLEPQPGQQAIFTTRIVRAERRYPDDAGPTYPLDGAKLKFFVPNGKAGTLEVRFDTPEGQGSFWETLRRAPPAVKAGEKAGAT